MRQPVVRVLAPQREQIGRRGRMPSLGRASLFPDRLLFWASQCLCAYGISTYSKSVATGLFRVIFNHKCCIHDSRSLTRSRMCDQAASGILLPARSSRSMSVLRLVEVFRRKKPRQTRPTTRIARLKRGRPRIPGGADRIVDHSRPYLRACQEVL